MYPLLAILPLFVGGLLALLLSAFHASIRYSKFAALAGSILSSVASIALLTQQQLYHLGWFTTGGYSFGLLLSIMPINQLLLLIIALISPLIFLYAIGYMDVPSEQGRFFFELSIFTMSMMLLAMSGDFLTMFIAWEGLGITSYLLIGFWYHRNNPPHAARKAITTILIGDILMLAGMLVIWSYFHTFVFSTIISDVEALSTIPFSLVAGLLMILFGAFTKSAQFPFHEWLADAMEGPTPVSAFLHSSTMVKAGVFVIAILLPIFAYARLLPVMLAIGLITTILGALGALSSSHIKKILAYSTVEDLGLMFVALGLNALAAALVFFVVQAFYKALMLMSSGTIIKANEDETYIYNLSAFGKNRVLLIAAFIGALSIAGIFPFSGFFGKIAIDSAASSNAVVYAILTVIDFVTAVYIFRWLFIPMYNQKRDPRHRLVGRYSALKKTMVVPQVALAALIFASAAYYIRGAGSLTAFLPGVIVETISALFGALIALILFRGTAGALSERSSTRNFLSKGFYVNAFYIYVTKFIQAIAHGIDLFDRGLNSFFYAGAKGVASIGNAIKVSQKGNVNVYIAALAVGIVLVIIMLVLIP